MNVRILGSGLTGGKLFDPIDLGPLRMARYGEPFTLLMGQLAYEQSDLPGVAYRFEHFAS
jgi:hypothetical protein